MWKAEDPETCSVCACVREKDPPPGLFCVLLNYPSPSFSDGGCSDLVEFGWGRGLFVLRALRMGKRTGGGEGSTLVVCSR